MERDGLDVQAAAKRQAPIEAPRRWRTRGACGSHAVRISRSSAASARPFGPPAAPGTMSISAARSPADAMRAAARAPARTTRTESGFMESQGERPASMPNSAALLATIPAFLKRLAARVRHLAALFAAHAPFAHVPEPRLRLADVPV